MVVSYASLFYLHYISSDVLEGITDFFPSTFPALTLEAFIFFVTLYMLLYFFEIHFIFVLWILTLSIPFSLYFVFSLVLQTLTSDSVILKFTYNSRNLASVHNPLSMRACNLFSPCLQKKERCLKLGINEFLAYVMQGHGGKVQIVITDVWKVFDRRCLFSSFVGEMR